MPRNTKIYSVFVASPGDVEAERDVLEEVVRKLNLTWSKTFGIQLELVKWETHSYPEFGEDSQQVITNPANIILASRWLYIYL